MDIPQEAFASMNRDKELKEINKECREVWLASYLKAWECEFNHRSFNSLNDKEKFFEYLVEQADIALDKYINRWYPDILKNKGKNL